ncbi:hypothetical protein [Sorangium sp. So ce542]|uniref:hypothetical protein n=1 Tax=Sorangium sp. So ce542 TaxID=3133316 RepID=UPI003F5FA0C6
MAATIFAANESTVLLNGQPIDGVRGIDYRHQQVRSNVYALGSAERIGMISGPQIVEGRLRVVSTSVALNALTGEAPFQITAMLKRGETRMTVTFDECYLLQKSLSLETGGVGEAVYEFTATRVREEPASASATPA